MKLRNAVLIAALIAGGSFYLTHWFDVIEPWKTAWKGLGVGLLAVWAAMKARSTDGWLLAAVLALGALGDVLLEAVSLTVGAVAFLAGHLVAVGLYLRNREKPVWPAALIAVVVAGISYALPADRAAAPGIALYALGLGAMAGTGWASRFSANGVALGALLFVISDLLIFARLGPMADSSLPGLLIWPTYFAGQVLIARGVVRTSE
ncbi:lysoplasmalogenase family protein [Sphingomonas sp. AOB5]|uniref:lysoplasmalogenase family protein n=1 Tax=Sphingomonas sp. AOB5 TaxID=3034017 RepID=UPI0023F6D613|nr:lysoplasmalogenase family protein [Sphingomonas sp. AOB5]MDF7774510.1 lysoplasmalogenase family protein [Sphingomonas sp. AOB5]